MSNVIISLKLYFYTATIFHSSSYADVGSITPPAPHKPAIRGTRLLLFEQCAVLGSDLGIDAVYVLSVKSFHERRAHISRELAQHGIPFEFIFDFDPEQNDLIPVPDRIIIERLPPPHRSLVLKHIHAWRLACQHGHRRILVFEDDVLLCPRFLEKLGVALNAASALSPGWLIFLGGADSKVPNWFFKHPGPLIARSIATAEAYVTDLTACRIRLSWCIANRIQLPADHLIRQIDATTDIAQYWLPEAILEQGSITGRFRSSLDDSRKKHTTFVNVARYRWNKLQRRGLRKLHASLLERILNLNRFWQNGSNEKR